MLGTMAGGAADCSFWIRKLKAEAQLYELTEGQWHELLASYPMPCIRIAHSIYPSEP